MEQDFSRQKTQYIFGSTLDTIQKRRLFFPWTIFPPKDFCKHFQSSSHSKKRFSRLSKAQTFNAEFTRKHQSPRHDLFILSFISVNRHLESSSIFYSWIFLLHTILRSLKSKDIRKFIQKQYFRLYSELSLSLHHLLKSVSPAV